MGGGESGGEQARSNSVPSAKPSHSLKGSARFESHPLRFEQDQTSIPMIDRLQINLGMLCGRR